MMSVPSVRKRTIAVMMNGVVYVSMRVMAVVMRMMVRAVMPAMMPATVTSAKVKSRGLLCLIAKNGRDRHGQIQKLTHDETPSIECRSMFESPQAPRWSARAAE
jgi:hypothetical protein